jgi:hypothetical protein
MRAFNHALPDENAASRGCDGAVENRNKSIAGGFDQPSVVLQNTGSYEFALDGFAPGEIDLLGSQEAPNILHIDIAGCRGQERSRPADITWALADPTSPECVGPFPPCILARRPGLPLRRDRQTAFRHSARATSMLSRSCSQQHARSLGSPCPLPPIARCGRAAVTGVPSSSSAPSPQACCAPPSSRQ